MITHRRVGIIGGLGWMGRSLGHAMLDSGVLAPDQLQVSSRTPGGDAYPDWPGVQRAASNQSLADASDIIVVSVRPRDLGAIAVNAPGKLVVSLLAMASVEELTRALGSDRVVRAMPNAAAEIRRAYFPWVASASVTEDDRELVRSMLGTCGAERELSDERQLDYMTALTGAGPAYPALLARAMLSHARASGIPDDVASEAVMQTLVGGALLLEQQNRDPGDMIDRLLDYDGTTAKGLKRMMAGGFDRLVGDGLDAAHVAARGTTPKR